MQDIVRAMDMHEDAVHMFEKVAIQLIAEGKEVHVHGTGPITEAAAGEGDQ